MIAEISAWKNFISKIEPGSSEDRIIGMIYGHALGDAVGLQSEFKPKVSGVEIKFPYDKPIRDYPKCDWTDDTDHLILVMQSLIATHFEFDECDFATRLKNWSINGFSELGDTTGLGLGGTTNMVIIHPKFLTNPSKAANDIWENAGRRIAPNGSLMRTSILGSIPSLDYIPELASDICSTTHADPRCVAACVFQSTAINCLIYDRIYANINDVMHTCLEESIPYVRGTSIDSSDKTKRVRGVPKSYVDTRFRDHEEEFLYWVNMAYSRDIDALALDESTTIGFVLKCLGCSVYALQLIHLAKKYKQKISFKKFIIRLAGEAGDADTNCAVAGATMGAYLGYSALPSDWIEALPNRHWLNEIIMKYIFALRDFDKF